MADGCEFPLPSFLPAACLSSRSPQPHLLTTTTTFTITFTIVTAANQTVSDSRLPGRRHAVVNDARAMRVAELMNDYRTLQLHISQQTAGVSSGDSQLDGHRVLAQGVAAAQQLLAAGFVNAPVLDSGNSAEAQTTQLKQVMLDASVRRFQAHKIYLRVAAAKRWIINHNDLSRSAQADQRATRLRDINRTLQSDLNLITDQSIYSDLRESDVRAGLWVDEDPPLAAISLWISSHR